MVKYTEMFSKSVIKKQANKVSLTDDQINAAEEWLRLIRKKELKKETSNYGMFMQTMLQRIFCIQNKTNSKSLHYKENHKNVEFYIYDGAKPICPIEAKGMNTNLDKPQNRPDAEKKTPITQIWGYIGDTPEVNFGICTNYQEFILMTKSGGKTIQHRFDFNTVNTDITGENISIDEQKLKEFIGIFRNSLFTKKNLNDLRNDSIKQEREITDEFYNLYHETRLMIIESLEKEHEKPKKESAEIAQTILNRLLFMFFTFDRKLVPNTFRNDFYSYINKEGSTLLREDTHRLNDVIDELFDKFTNGGVIKIDEETFNVPAFNGGLFNENNSIPRQLFSDLISKDTVKMFDMVKHTDRPWKHKLEQRDRDVAAAIRSIPDLNPIFENMLFMDAYDFTSELTVKILGHIFEQSLEDLTNIFNTEISTRKAQGAYYTSERFTDHVCRNTIIPALSKSGEKNDVDQLISEYVETDELGVLIEKFKNIKILDPACGSGAFLLKAVDVLYEIVTEINNQQIDQHTLDVYTAEEASLKIIEKNIFGVDLNSSAVEITKLSLFFKIASGTKLPDLNCNIMHGNSLIEPEDSGEIKIQIKENEKFKNKLIKKTGNEIDKNAFAWKKKFPNVFDSGGFDVIIGNPPWDKVKGTIEEFYAPYYDSEHDDKFRLLSANMKLNYVDRIDTERPEVKSKYDHYDELRKKLLSFVSTCKTYKGLLNGGDLNMYQLFMLKSFWLLKNNGYMSLIVPSSLYIDCSSYNLRKILFEKSKLHHILGFINEKGVFFKDVHKQYKFCVFALSKTSHDNYNILCSFKNIKHDILKTFLHDAFIIPSSIINNSDLMTIPEFDNSNKISAFEKLLKFPTMSRFEFSSEIHMTNHKLYFEHDTGNEFPLLEGKKIHQFNNKYVEPEYYISASSLEAIKTPDYDDHKRYRIAWRDITNAIDLRTLYATIIPPNYLLGNTLNYCRTQMNSEELFYYCGMLNSHVVDFFFRQRVNLHVSLFIMKNCPIPILDKKNKLHKNLIENTIRIFNHYDTESEFNNLIESLDSSYDIDKTCMSNDQLLTLKNKNSAIVARIYGLTPDELNAVLSDFVKAKKSENLKIAKKNNKQIVEEFTRLNMIEKKYKKKSTRKQTQKKKKSK